MYAVKRPTYPYQLEWEPLTCNCREKSTSVSNSIKIKKSSSSKAKRRAGILGVFLAAFLGATVVFAAWTTNSSPWAPGATDNAKHPEVSALVVNKLQPGDCNDVSLTVYNPNNKGVTITGLGNQGFRNVSDTAPSENGNANRLEDFLTQANVSSALSGKVVNGGASKTFVVSNAVCLSAQADDARQDETFEAGYFVAYQLNPGNEAP